MLLMQWWWSHVANATLVAIIKITPSPAIHLRQDFKCISHVSILIGFEFGLSLVSAHSTNNRFWVKTSVAPSNTNVHLNSALDVCCLLHHYHWSISGLFATCNCTSEHWCSIFIWLVFPSQPKWKWKIAGSSCSFLLTFYRKSNLKALAKIWRIYLW